jgi:MYXO-CTERM domain-containing protein
MIKITQAAVAIAVAGAPAVPNAASASVLLNTGTPTGSGAPLLLYSAQSLAAEFSASAGATSIGSLSAYLTKGTAQAGDSFTFDIYKSLPTTSNRSPQPIFSTSANWEQNGWTTATVDWTLPGTGDYWLVLKNSSSGRSSYQFDAPQLTSSSAGPVPALAFEAAPTDGFFAATTASFGVEVISAPEPSSAVLALVGAVFLTRWRRRSKTCRAS